MLHSKSVLRERGENREEGKPGSATARAERERSDGDLVSSDSGATEEEPEEEEI
jgi:hypothetical protein